jgi:hypothetical protein
MSIRSGENLKTTTNTINTINNNTPNATNSSINNTPNATINNNTPNATNTINNNTPNATNSSINNTPNATPSATINNIKNVIKIDKMAFCSVLKDHPDVLKQSRIYPYVNIKYDEKKIPETFDGRDVWSMFIQTPSDEMLSSSWAHVAKDILNDRFCLFTAAQLHILLDYVEIITCIDKKPLKRDPKVQSTNNIDNKSSIQGYSIYDAWEYIYSNGVSQWNCISRRYLNENKIPAPDKLTYEDKKSKKLYDKYCSDERSGCLRLHDGKQVAKRVFFNSSIINIEGNDMKERIMNIKYQIVKWGPVAAGFLVYDNFINEYDGLDVYSKTSGKILGGHYVSIVGWGKDYWICRNSFGADWGLLGYFYMKMGIEECKLEYNVSTTGPSLPNYKVIDKDKNVIKSDEKKVKNGLLYDGTEVFVNDMESINPYLYKIRKSLDIDYKLFYTKKTIEEIKSGKLFGSLTPLIVYPELLPNLDIFWLKNLRDYDYINIAGKTFYESNGTKKKNTKWYFYIIILIGLLLSIFGYLRYRTYKKK